MPDQLSLETWFRGEGVGVPPARPGGYLQDFGDGMYLTDSQDVAGIYARRRAPIAANQRVLTVTLERISLGRVLDLSMDPRWTQFMNTPLSKSTGSRLYYLKIKHELYNQFFEEFLELHKIDIKSFDAVVGPEYNLGGRQLCILHRNGLPSGLNLRIRALFRSATSPIRIIAKGGKFTVTFAEGMTPSPRIRFLKGAGGFIASIGISVLISYLLGKVKQWSDTGLIERQLRAFDPEIQRALEASKRKMFDIVDNGHKAYAVVHFNVKTSKELVSRNGEMFEVETTPVVEFVWADIRDYKIEKQGQMKVPPPRLGGMDYSTPYTTSSELAVPKEEAAAYRVAIDELNRYDAVMSDRSLTASDKERISAEKQALRNLIDTVFGKPEGGLSSEEFAEMAEYLHEHSN